MAKADALDLESMKKAAEGSSHIYHCMGLPSYAVWAENFPTMMTNVIEAAASQGSETKVIYIDNLYMYGKESALRGPLTENTPHLASGKKGMLRSKLANQLLQAHNDGRLKATIGRGSDFFGPGGKSSIYDIFVFPKVIRGKKVRMFGNLDKLHSVMYLDDVVKGLVILAENEVAFGHAWHLPHTTLTTRELIEIAFDEAGIDSAGKIGTNPKFMLSIAGLFIKLVREVKEVIYQTEIDWVVDHSKFENTFGISPSPIREGIRQTIEWYKENT
jgi:nucleoside-diphosphate-sugar epimerase